MIQTEISRLRISSYYEQMNNMDNAILLVVESFELQKDKKQQVE
jgi:hypothetical protein